MPDDDSKSVDPIGPPPSASGFELLRRDGVPVLPPEQLRPGQVRGCLWELIYALAARRVFFQATDHLSDAQLYCWLYYGWLPREMDDVPATVDWNCMVDVGDVDDSASQSWLGDDADEALRSRWARDYPDEAAPPSDIGPCDRDRWLPAPAVSYSATEPDGGPEIEEAETTAATVDELNDPLQLDAVDREIHVEHSFLETPDPLGLETGPGDSPAMPLDRSMGFESEGWTRPHDELARSGVSILPPDEMTDELLPAKLWELLHELACRGFYLLHTDHLTDRELYAKLWRENLRAPAILPGRSTSGGWFQDFVGSGSEEDTELWLRYYANDEERESHAREYPDEPLPPRCEPISRRDHRVPRGPF